MHLLVFDHNQCFQVSFFSGKNGLVVQPLVRSSFGLDQTWPKCFGSQLQEQFGALSKKAHVAFDSSSEWKNGVYFLTQNSRLNVYCSFQSSQKYLKNDLNQFCLPKKYLFSKDFFSVVIYSNLVWCFTNESSLIESWVFAREIDPQCIFYRQPEINSLQDFFVSKNIFFWRSMQDTRTNKLARKFECKKFIMHSFWKVL